jgi:hypothetical protein
VQRLRGGLAASTCLGTGVYALMLWVSR